MPTRPLSDWLAYIEQQHPRPIAMGLERVREVAARMSLGKPAKRVITVGGTNGKGSTVAFIEAIPARMAGRPAPTPRRTCCATTSACASTAQM